MSFIEEFRQLQLETPRIAIVNTNAENSAYTNYSTFNRNCYLVFGTHYSEDAYYTQYSVGLTSCVDCDDVEKSELCYECSFCEKCYNCAWGAYLMGCSDCEYSYDLVNCQSCFLCVGMQNQSYCILNESLSKEQYEEKRKFLLRTYTSQELLAMMEDLRKKVPQRAVYQKNCDNCVGSNLRNSKNLIGCFNVKNAEDVIYGGTNVNQCKDAMDVDNIAATLSQDLYNSLGVTGGYGLVCCNSTWFSSNCSYCENVFNSHDCFGCISRNHAEYQILNQQYTKEDYFKRIEQIKDELRAEGMWGVQWLPSTYPYSDSIAQQYYPEQ